MEGNFYIDPQQYLSLVKVIVERFDVQLPAHWDKEDMISYGILGLLEAIQRFQPEKGVKFTTFASKRIRGAILDALRKDSPLSRNCWQKVRKITDAMERISHITYQEASWDEIAKEAGLSKSEISEVMQSFQLLSHISLEQTLGFANNDEIKIEDTIKLPSDSSPEETFIKNEQVEILGQAISQLEKRHRLVLTLYYYEELSLKEIAAVLDVSVSRVSQLKTMALALLRVKLEKMMISAV